MGFSPVYPAVFDLEGGGGDDRAVGNPLRVEGEKAAVYFSGVIITDLDFPQGGIDRAARVAAFRGFQDMAVLRGLGIERPGPDRVLLLPPVVKNIEQGDEFGGRLLAPGRVGMIVTRGISQRVFAGDDDMLDGAVVPPVMRPRRGQDVVEVEDGDIVERIGVVREPVEDEPIVEGPGVEAYCRR